MRQERMRANCCQSMRLVRLPGFEICQPCVYICDRVILFEIGFFQGSNSVFDATISGAERQLFHVEVIKVLGDPIGDGVDLVNHFLTL